MLPEQQRVAVVGSGVDVARASTVHSDERHSSASVRPPLGPVHVSCWRAGAPGATTAADGCEVTHLAAVAEGLTGGPAVTGVTVGVASAADALLLSRPVPPRTAAASPELPRSRVEAGGWMRRGGGGGGGDGAANSTGVVGSYSSSGLGSCGSSSVGSCGSGGRPGQHTLHHGCQTFRSWPWRWASWDSSSCWAKSLVRRATYAVVCFSAMMS